MMRWIVESSLQFRLVVVALAVVVMAIGFAQLRNAPVDVLPEFEAPYVEVQTEALGLSAAEVEQLITVPLEADLLNGVAWLKTIRSESMPGLSSVVLIFEPGTDLMKARQVVQERLTQAHALPNVSKAPAMLQPLSSTSRVMNVGLSSKELSLIDMSVLARWTMKPRLMGVPGVAHVSIWGQRKRQMQVQVDPERLRDAGLTLNDIVKTTGDALWVSPLSFLNASYPGTGGYIETPNQRLGIRHVLPITNPGELGRVAISGRQDMTLDQVATVVENHQPLIGDALLDNGTGLLLVIEKFPWANTVQVTKGVEKALAQLAPGLGGMELDSRVFRPATYLETATSNLSKSWLIGLALGAVALLLLVMEWRSALISIVAIPLSLIAAALVLYSRQGSFDLMVLAGLAVALSVIVDDAIGDVRNIVRRLRQHRAEGGQEGIAKVILEGSLEMRSSLAFATFILLLLAVPTFVLFGVTGAVLKPLAASYMLAIVCSLFVTMTVTPALTLFLFRNGAPSGGESPLVRGLRGISDRMVAQGVRTPAMAMGTMVFLLIVGVALFFTMEIDDVVPTFKETDILIRAEGAPGTSHPEMARIVSSASAELRTVPGVRNVGAHVGRAVMSEEVVNVNAAEIWVSVDPAGDYETTLDAIAAIVDSYPGLNRDLLTYGQESVTEAMTGDDEDLVVRVYGEDPEHILAEAERVREVVATVDGIVDPKVEKQIVEPVIQIEADMAACQKYGIKPGDIRRASAILLGGIEVGMLFEEQKVFDVVVWGQPDIRQSVTDVRELLIDTPAGGHVRLGEVANVQVAAAPVVIEREGVNRRLDVTANVHGRGINEVASEVQKKLNAMEFPMEFHASVVGHSKEREVANQRTRNLAIACAIGTLLLLQAAFGSWRLGGVAFLALPVGVSGGLIASRLMGGTLATGHIIGLFAVLALAVRFTITLINSYQRAEQRGEPFSPELVQNISRERFGALLTTTVVTGLLMLPLAILGSIAGQEILNPMAITMLGGLVTTALLASFVVPAIYMRFGEGSVPEWTADVEEEQEPTAKVQYG